MKKYLSLLLFFVLQGCCWLGCDDDPNQDDWEQGVQVSKQYLWKRHRYYTYTDSGILTMAEDLYYDNGYFSGNSPEKDESYYEFRKIETGDLIWRLQNPVLFYNKRDIRLDDSYAHQYQHYVMTEPFYPLCFNLKTGKVQWRLNKTDWSIKLAGFEDKYFFQKEYAKDQYALYECNIVTGKVQEVFKFVNKNPSVITSRKTGGVIKPFRDAKGDILIVIPILDDYKSKDSKYYLGLYNDTKKKWIYQEIPINTKSGGCSGIQLYGQKIFLMMSQGFACHRLDTGKEIWSTRAYNKFSKAGPWHEGAVWKNRLVVAMGDDHVMCLDMDADREHVLWRADGHGSGVGKFHMLNGIVYFADGKVHAIDVATGKYLWHLKSPDLKRYGSDAFFKRGLWVIPGKGDQKGRVIANTHRSGVCYEAIR